MIPATRSRPRMQHVYKLGDHTLLLDRVHGVLCPDGNRRTAQITGYDPSLGLHQGHIQVKKQRICGYVQSATKIDATFLPEPLPSMAHPLAPLIVVLGFVPHYCRA